MNNKKVLIHFKIKAHPNSKREKVVEKSQDSFEVFVKEKAERGLANKAVIRVLSSYFKVSAGKLRLVKGARSQNKIFEVGL